MELCFDCCCYYVVAGNGFDPPNDRFDPANDRFNISGGSEEILLDSCRGSLVVFEGQLFQYPPSLGTGNLQDSFGKWMEGLGLLRNPRHSLSFVGDSSEILRDPQRSSEMPWHSSSTFLVA